MLWDEFDDAWGADDEEWVDPEERENREYAIVTSCGSRASSTN